MIDPVAIQRAPARAHMLAACRDEAGANLHPVCPFLLPSIQRFGVRRVNAHFLERPMITQETLDSVKQVAADADTSGLLIELEGAVLDQIGGGKTQPWAV